jgi:predicted nucleic acid-binding protein
MIVVSDTGPLNYLILIQQIDILGQLYDEVIIPPAVQDEMLNRLAPNAVRAWIENPPLWLEVRTPSRVDANIDPTLDEGEREAIALLQSVSEPGLLLIDDLPGRVEATRLGLDIIGTLGVLLVAHKRRLLDIRESIKLLRLTSFKANEALLSHFLSQA